MNGSIGMPTSSGGDAVPTSCPICQSTAIVTSAKSPDADAYWRCTKCGEVWNAARAQPRRFGGRPWR
jgi:predicted Zn finger-like uncharacterized protein